MQHTDRVRERVFSVATALGDRTPGVRLLCAAADAVSGLAALQRRYRTIEAESPAEFLDCALERLEIAWNADATDVARIPAAGPVVVVANHPYGGAEGMVLARLLLQIRPDVRVMGNRFLSLIPDLRELFVPVDPFGGHDANARSRAGLRQAVEHLAGGGLLAVFPAGEVASLDLRRGTVDDPPWTLTATRLARRTGATLVPVFFSGRNGVLFQLAGLVHPALRTALLPRQLLKRRGRPFTLAVGRPVLPASFASAPDTDVTGMLRWRTRLLAHRNRGAAPTRKRAAGAPVAGRIAAATLRTEVEALPPSATLAAAGSLCVVIAAAESIPSLLLEIGRAREVAFRAASEGTGRSRDIDRFDHDYLHLVLWDSDAGAVAGAYRLGQTDVLCGGRGVAGLYTSTLFRFGTAGIGRIHPALEMGRSFILPEYQRSHAALLLLWQGIGAFVVGNPRYRFLFGPVSISREYGRAARELMVRYLGAAADGGGLLPAVRPRRPFHPRPRHGLDFAQIAHSLASVDELSEVVADLEGGRGVPVLVRQYLRLGGRVASFNVDREFSDVVDALVVVDLVGTERRLLDRYMGRAGAETFLAHHRAELRDADVANAISPLSSPLGAERVPGPA